ncbi:hypothetical protein FRX31_017118, partial [Thalictrum thalictroides]
EEEGKENTWTKEAVAVGYGRMETERGRDGGCGCVELLFVERRRDRSRREERRQLGWAFV